MIEEHEEKAKNTLNSKEEQRIEKDTAIIEMKEQMD